MKHKVYIDGQAGTTGLQLREKLENHKNIELLLIAEELRKDGNERRRLLNEAEIVFLCLPDEAAKESVAMIENPNVCVIDASTAHRTHSDWTYGFPELSVSHREQIQKAKRIANPGCHATGFIAVVYPLIAKEMVSKDYPFSVHSITGYSGGGKAMIADYENPNREECYDSPRQYGLSQMHKHLPEMVHVTGMTESPIFCPIVADFHSGMATTVTLHRRQMEKKITKDELVRFFEEYYKNEAFIHIMHEESGFLASNSIVGKNDLHIYIEGNDERMTITSVFDNLGKGASGAAVQNMNIVLGLDESEGLV